MEYRLAGAVHHHDQEKSTIIKLSEILKSEYRFVGII